MIISLIAQFIDLLLFHVKLIIVTYNNINFNVPDKFDN